MTPMNERVPVNESRSIPELLRDLANDVTRLIRNEIGLARAETTEGLSRMAAGAAMMAVGAILGLAALIILLDAMVYGLANHMPAWLAAVIVGGVVALIGFIMVRKGQNDLSAAQLAPRRTAEQVGRDAQLVKEHVS